jgi:bacteriocin biosynthesis cyclodehydratase domain-containing protein
MNEMILFVEGPFGDAVAERLQDNATVRVVPLAASEPHFAELVSGADSVAAALWRPYVAQLDALDEACAAARKSWSAAVLDRETLFCGPSVVPGGPCYRCFRRRWLAWVPALEREQALDAAWAADPARGIHGFVPAAVTMAAASLLLDARDGRAGAGRVRQINLLTMDVTETRVVPVHACPRCGPPRGPRGARFVERIAPVVAEVLS